MNMRIMRLLEWAHAVRGEVGPHMVTIFTERRTNWRDREILHVPWLLEERQTFR